MYQDLSCGHRFLCTNNLWRQKFTNRAKKLVCIVIMVGANALEKNSLVFVKYGAPSDLSNTCNFFSFLLYYYGNILKKFMVSCNKFNVSVSTNSCILQNTSVPLIHHTRSLKRSLFFYIILDVILINDLLRDRSNARRCTL